MIGFGINSLDAGVFVKVILLVFTMGVYLVRDRIFANVKNN
jgi:hypothetical protein